MVKTKRNKDSFLEGFISSIDLFGRDFDRRPQENTVEQSWQNVGEFFTKAFSDFKTRERSASQDKHKKPHYL